MTPAPSVSIVIPTLGCRTSLDRCLQRLAAQDAPSGLFEVLLVADATATADVPVLARRVAAAGLGGRGRVLSAAFPGASAARNTGWRAARAPLVLFLDDDVLADSGLVTAHMDAHIGLDSSDGVLGSLRWASGVRVTPFMRWLEDGIQFDYAAIVAARTTGWWHFYTCNVSVRRSLLEAVDGFDEVAFPFGFEDLDIGRRMDAAAGGLRLRYVPAASAEHEHAMDLRQWLGRVQRIAGAERRFVERYPECRAAFHERFVAAAARPALRGRAARLAPLVPRRVPLLGERVHQHAEAWYAQQLAQPFLLAWDAAGAHVPGPRETRAAP